MIKNKAVLLGGIFVLLIAISRFLPHPYNFTPVGALALFGGAIYRKKGLLILITILALFMTDLVLNNTLMRGFFEGSGMVWFSEYMIWVYGSFILLFFVAYYMLKKFSYKKLFVTAISGSLMFFLVTNFGSWLTSGLYPLDISGLSAAYISGIPFYKFTMLGDIVYSFIIFGVYDLVTRQVGIPSLIVASK